MIFLQANLNRAHDAHNLLLHTAREKEVDVLLVSEPNRKVCNEHGRKPDAAIYVMDNKLRVEAAPKGQKFPGVRIYSCYFSPNRGAPKYQHQLDLLEQDVRRAPGEVILTGDFNAKSPE